MELEEFEQPPRIMMAEEGETFNFGQDECIELEPLLPEASNNSSVLYDGSRKFYDKKSCLKRTLASAIKKLPFYCLFGSSMILCVNFGVGLPIACCCSSGDCCCYLNYCFIWRVIGAEHIALCPCSALASFASAGMQEQWNFWDDNGRRCCSSEINFRQIQHLYELDEEQYIAAADDIPTIIVSKDNAKYLLIEKEPPSCKRAWCGCEFTHYTARSHNICCCTPNACKKRARKKEEVHIRKRLTRKWAQCMHCDYIRTAFKLEQKFRKIFPRELLPKIYWHINKQGTEFQARLVENLLSQNANHFKRSISITEKELLYCFNGRYQLDTLPGSYAIVSVLNRYGWAAHTKSKHYPIRCKMKYFDKETLPDKAKEIYAPREGPAFYAPYSPQLVQHYKFEEDPAYRQEYEKPTNQKITHLLALRQRIIDQQN